jgi:hypothetical protein
MGRECGVIRGQEECISLTGEKTRSKKETTRKNTSYVCG